MNIQIKFNNNAGQIVIEDAITWNNDGNIFTAVSKDTDIIVPWSQIQFVNVEADVNGE